MGDIEKSWGMAAASSPTPGLHLGNLGHPGRCKKGINVCCWERKGLAINGKRSNRSQDIYRTFATADRISQRDLQQLDEYKSNADILQRHNENPRDFAAFQRARSLDPKSMYPNLHTMDVTLANTVRANVPYGYGPEQIYHKKRVDFSQRGPAGLHTTFANKTKIANFSSVGYDIVLAGGFHGPDSC